MKNRLKSEIYEFNIYVVITLEIATEALVELSDSIAVTLIEDTQGAPREGNKDLTKFEVITSLFS